MFLSLGSDVLSKTEVFENYYPKRWKIICNWVMDTKITLNEIISTFISWKIITIEPTMPKTALNFSHKCKAQPISIIKKFKKR